MMVVPAASGSADRASSSPVTSMRSMASLSRPMQADPGREGRTAVSGGAAFTAQSAQPAVPAAGSQTPPSRGRIFRPAPGAGRYRARTRSAQLGRAETGLYRGKSRPGPGAVADLPVLRRRPSGLDRPGRRANWASTSTTGSWPRSPTWWPSSAWAAADLRTELVVHQPDAACGARPAGRDTLPGSGRGPAAAPADRPAGLSLRRADHGPRVTGPQVTGPQVTGPRVTSAAGPDPRRGAGQRTRRCRPGLCRAGPGRPGAGRR